MKKEKSMDAVPLEHVIESLARKDRKENIMSTCVNDLEYHLQNLMNEPPERRDQKLTRAFIKEVSRFCQRDAERRIKARANSLKGGEARKRVAEDEGGNRKQRNRKIIEKAKDGDSASKIADYFNISRQRVYQILKKELLK